MKILRFTFNYRNIFSSYFDLFSCFDNVHNILVHNIIYKYTYAEVGDLSFFLTVREHGQKSLPNGAL